MSRQPQPPDPATLTQPLQHWVLQSQGQEHPLHNFCFPNLWEEKPAWSLQPMEPPQGHWYTCMLSPQLPPAQIPPQWLPKDGSDDLWLWYIPLPIESGMRDPVNDTPSP